MTITATAIRSPLIASVADEVAAGRAGAEDAFWARVTLDGAPLMEEVEDDPRSTLLTFVWRDDGNTDNVLVLFFSAPTDGDFSEFRMERLAGTGIWYRTYLVPSELRTTYLLSVNDDMTPFSSYAEVLERLPTYRPDPLNTAAYTLMGNPNEFTVSVLELPGAPRQPWNIPRRGVPRGEVTMETLDSDRTGSRHHVMVYRPSGYSDAGEPHPLLVLFDGWSYYNFAAVTTVLDNLVYTGRIPPYVIVMHTNEDQEVRARELPCDDAFQDFLVSELLPWVEDRYNVTDDPSRTVVAGSCFGGLAAVYAAFRAPHRFGNVISQSGSFWWPGAGVPGVPDRWLIQKFRDSATLPIRFSLEIGALEQAIIEYDPMASHREMRDVLLEKGYEVDYSEYMGGHDMVCWRGTLVDRLLSFHPRDAAAVNRGDR